MNILKHIDKLTKKAVRDFPLFRFGFLVIFFASNAALCLGQSGERHAESKIDCNLPRQLGFFIQVSDGKWEPPKGDWPRWERTKAKIEDDEWWTPSDLDSVLPRYKFIFSEKPDGMSDGKCAKIADMKGQLISPGGKVFRFEKATFDRSTLLLSFKTIARFGFRYEGEFQYHAKPVRVGRTYQDGNMKLTAFGEALGSATLTFPVESDSGH